MIFLMKGCSCVMKPKVTVGVCVKNAEATIKDAIESILVQDFPHELMEVIFVDDGSDDKTLSIINSYVPKMDMQVKVFHQEWKGLGATRNVVVNNASGDYIVWTDGDMILPRDHVRKQVEFMEKNQKVGIAKARYGICSGENLLALLEDAGFLAVDSKHGGKVTSRTLGTGGSIYRVEAIRQVGGFNDGITGVGEDMDAEYRIRKAGWLTYMGTTALFYERRMQAWKDFWDKYLWYGYGDYHLYRKNRNLFSLYKMVPIAGFVAGALYTPNAYRLTRRKSVFLLPFHFAFKMAAWCLGFIKGQIEFIRGEKIVGFFGR